MDAAERMGADRALAARSAGPDATPADFDRERDLGVLAQIESELAGVEAALDRLESGTYGICEACSGPIEDSHLEMLPASRFCAAHQDLDLSRSADPT
ncbi:MAG: TraR/DksA C4-type zinc finger protein [Acidimicrobiales bacterium]